MPDSRDKLTPVPFAPFEERPKRDTEPSGELPEDEPQEERGTLAGFNASLERLEEILSENDRTVKRALHELGTLVVAHYQRSTKRADDEAVRVGKLEKRVDDLEKRFATDGGGNG